MKPVFYSLFLILCLTGANAATITDLRVEYMKNPVGVDVTQPRFSWKMQSDEKGAAQTAYQITVATDDAFKQVVWNSGEIASGKSVHIVYEGKALQPATRYFWKVQVKNQQARKITSSGKAFFETGLLNSGWSGAQWIQAGTSEGIPMFRNEFTLNNKEIRSARLYSSGLGNYDVFINGKRVGTRCADGTVTYDEFKPGWTAYQETVFYNTYDVKDWLTRGTNAIGAQVTSGWWNGGIAHGDYGNPPLGFIAKLVITYTDGSTSEIITQPQTWKYSTDGAIRMADIYNGETCDARKETAWTSPGFDDTTWQACRQNIDIHGRLIAFIGPAVQIRPELQRIIDLQEPCHPALDAGSPANEQGMAGQARHDITLKKGQNRVYDFGQNIVGWVHFKVKGKAGTTLTIRFAEMLNDTGDSARGNDGASGTLYLINLRSAKATLKYTLKGDPQGEEFHPSASFFGFRYCDIQASEEVEIESLTGQVVGTAAEEGSSFATSNGSVNQLYNNVLWGQRGNFLSIPTDCPQRDERLGWTGDIQIFGRAATYNADLDAFFRKWLGDMRDDQREDGAYPNVAPYTWGVGYGASAWAEAGIVTPWITYLMYGDTRILEENYGAMEKYMEFLSKQSRDGYRYNGGHDTYGDWVSYVYTDNRYISVCYYAYAALLMEKTAQALNKTEKAAAYRTLYNNIKAEFQTRYVENSGQLKIDTQTAYLLALKLHLFATETARRQAIDHLRQLIVDNGNKLNTGFVGTGIITQTLSDVGLTDIAYNLLLQRENPSWLYSVDQGATTIWERWNSYTKESGFHPDITMNSFNHYAYGAVAEWLFRYVAGINPDENNPGFKHILLNPSPDFRTVIPAGQERITWVNATYNSYYGKIRSAWKIESNGNVKYDITIPANTTATLTLVLQTGKEQIQEGKTIVPFRTENGKAVIELPAGNYSFTVKQ